MADRIVDLLTLAGVLALVALPVAVIVIGVLVWINRRRARAIKDWAARHGDLKRRLADVEAIRSDGVVRAVTLRGKPVEVHTRGDFIKVGAFRYSTDLLAEGIQTPDDCLARIQANGDVVEVTIFRVSEIRKMLECGRAFGDPLTPAPGVYREDQGRCEVPPAGWDCTREPGHDGPCAAVPSMIREHLGDDAIQWTPEAGRAAVDRERLK